jgi:hypothetical protein
MLTFKITLVLRIFTQPGSLLKLANYVLMEVLRYINVAILTRKLLTGLHTALPVVTH